ncbi:MAG: hypothetical protein ACK553_04420 [Planctomycetota bacterium]|jgi:hypothetical protein
MRRSINGLAGALLLMVGTGGFVQADWPSSKHHAHVDIARNNAWPQPFRGQDAFSVVAPFEVMKRNGWRDNNTVGSILFTNNQLTEAGRLKVANLLTSTPASQRTIYVQVGPTQDDTAARVESVQEIVSQLLPEGQLPPIQITSVAPSTSPGAYQTLMHRAIKKTTPAPRLPIYSGMAQPAQPQMAPQENE